MNSGVMPREWKTRGPSTERPRVVVSAAAYIFL